MKGRLRDLTAAGAAVLLVAAVGHPRGQGILLPRVLFLAILGSAFGFFRAEAQTSLPLDPDPSCPNCTLALDTMFTLSGTDADSGPLDAVWGVVKDASERVWVSFGSAAPLMVYAATGEIEFVVPRGEGPGEAMLPQAMVPVGDSMAVLDSGLGRVTVFGPNLELTRTFRLDGQFFSGLLLEWPLMVLNGLVPDPDGFGHPLHLLDLERGRLVKSFGSLAPGSFTARDTHRLFVTIVSGGDPSHFFVVPRSELSIQRWSAGGELLDVLVGHPEWFPPGGDGRMGSSETPPNPTILSAVRRDGIVFTSVHLPRADWRQAWARLPPGSDVHAPGQMAPPREAVYDYYLVGIDLAEQRVINRWAVEDPFRQFTRTSGFATTGVTDSLSPVLKIVLPSVVRPP